MVSNISQIVYQLFQKETLADVSESELRYFVKQYPFSGTGHLLLAKKLQLAGEKRALERETAFAALYFSNPAWLQYVLSGDKIRDTGVTNTSFFVEHTDSGNTNLLIPEYNEEPVNQDLADNKSESIATTSYPEPIVVPGLVIANEKAEQETEKSGSVLVDETEKIAVINADSIQQEFSDPVKPIIEEKVRTESNPLIPEPVEHVELSQTTETDYSPATSETSEIDQGIETPQDPGPTQQTAETPDSAPAQPMSPVAKPADSNEALPKLEFDPYHTIDYFASQGIKLRLDDYSRDKLGQQLKSFTEWIRSMKRLPQQQSENNMNETDQHSIRKIAEHSVEEKEVLTESMAEVWAKQGNYEKARQIYRKLSLQNPSKSTYFAAKIEQLKVL